MVLFTTRRTVRPSDLHVFLHQLLQLLLLPLLFISHEIAAKPVDFAPGPPEVDFDSKTTAAVESLGAVGS